MTNISSVDFRNVYERFYACMRNYLWPYQTLRDLGEVEVDIYSAFIDVDKLKADFTKLLSDIREACNEDEDLAKQADAISELIEMTDTQPYMRIRRVEEVNQEKDKQIRTIPRTEDDES